eukprot:13074263-Ditylum_brightwellii.AAC.1
MIDIALAAAIMVIAPSSSTTFFILLLTITCYCGTTCGYEPISNCKIAYNDAPLPCSDAK